VHGKLEEHVMTDFLDYAGVDFTGVGACIWAQGVSQVGITEEEYEKVTLGYPLAAARALVAANPAARFVFLTGRSSDPTERGRSLLSRIKGRAERLLGEVCVGLSVFRPGYIRPTARSVPRRDAGRFFAPVGALLGVFTDTLSVDCEVLARGLLQVAKEGGAEKLLSNAAILKLFGGRASAS
jgi:hypothetical protein